MKQLYKIIILGSLFLSYFHVKANNIKIENVAYDASTSELSFDVSWENAWHINANYKDAVWIFAKYKNTNSQQWKPLRFTFNSSINFASLNARIFTQGARVSLANSSVSQVDVGLTRITLEVISEDRDVLVNPSFKVFGIESVLVPTGPFYLGDGSNESLYNDTGIGTVKLIENAEDKSFRLFSSDNVNTLFDGLSNGYSNFHMMKYELTQTQLVDFFNCLTVPQQEGLLDMKLSDITDANKYVLTETSTPKERNAIVYDATTATFGVDLNNNGIMNEADDGGTIACNYLSFAIALAYLDWSHMKPASSFQYEKAARGSDIPVAFEGAWGSPTLNRATTISNAGTDKEIVNEMANVNIGSLDGPVRVGFAAKENSDRYSSGGSFYGIMNLSDNVKEFYLYSIISTINDGDGYIIGDGVLSVNGFTNNQFYTSSRLDYFILGGAYNSEGRTSEFYYSVSTSDFEFLEISSEKSYITKRPTMGLRGIN